MKLNELLKITAGVILVRRWAQQKPLFKGYTMFAASQLDDKALNSQVGFVSHYPTFLEIILDVDIDER